MTKSPKTKAESSKLTTDSKHLSTEELIIKKEAEMSKVLSSSVINDNENAEIVFENENYSDDEE